MQGALSIVQSATQRYLEQRTPCENFNPNAYGCYEFDREVWSTECAKNDVALVSPLAGAAPPFALHLGGPCVSRHQDPKNCGVANSVGR